MRKVSFLPLYLALFFFLLALSFMGCGGGGGGGGGGPTISGKIENWQPGYTLKAYIEGDDEDYFYGNISVDNQGYFTYNLPPPNPNHLSPITFEGDEDCEVTQRPTVSPNDSKMGFLDLKAVVNSQERDVELMRQGGGQPSPNTPMAGDYIFLDRATTFTGTLEERCSGEPIQRIQFDNVSLPAGWNYVEFVFVSYDSQTNTLTLKVVPKSSPSPELKWMIEN
ncbi:MAG: hypothetical protein ACK4OF_02145 [Aquificaceae bacterium]